MIGAPLVNARCDGRDCERPAEQCRASVVFAVPLVIERALLPALLAQTEAGWGYSGEQVFCPRCVNLLRVHHQDTKTPRREA